MNSRASGCGHSFIIQGCLSSVDLQKGKMFRQNGRFAEKNDPNNHDDKIYKYLFTKNKKK